MKIMKKTPDFPQCSAKRNTPSPFEYSSRWHFVFAFFPLINMHHNGFTKSFACCLSCESCLCAQCQCLGREQVMLGWGGGGHTPVCLALKLPYIHGGQVKPPWGELNLGGIIFYLIKYLRFKKKKRNKTNSFFKCWAFLSNFTKNVQKKESYCTDICDQHF